MFLVTRLCKKANSRDSAVSSGADLIKRSKRHLKLARICVIAILILGVLVTIPTEYLVEVNLFSTRLGATTLFPTDSFITSWENEEVKPIRTELRRGQSFIQDVVLLPQDVLLLVRLPTADSGFSAKENLLCLFHQRISTAVRGVEYLNSRAAIRCELPSDGFDDDKLSVSDVALLDTRSGILIAEGGNGNSSTKKWNSVVFELWATDADIVLLAKGINNRQGRNAKPSSLRCVFNGEIETAVTVSAQELFRCKHPPLELRRELSGKEVTLKLEGKLLPSVVYYESKSRLSIPSSSSSSSDGDEGDKSFLCACTMVYNVAKFMREWVMYHSHLGVERFFLYDNNSEDGLEEVVEGLARYNVTRFPWPWVKTQEAGFSHCALMTKSRCKWMMFIDVDEFVYPPGWLDGEEEEQGSVSDQDHGSLGDHQSQEEEEEDDEEGIGDGKSENPQAKSLRSSSSEGQQQQSKLHQRSENPQAQSLRSKIHQNSEDPKSNSLSSSSSSSSQAQEQHRLQKSENPPSNSLSFSSSQAQQQQQQHRQQEQQQEEEEDHHHHLLRRSRNRPSNSLSSSSEGRQQQPQHHDLAPLHRLVLEMMTTGRNSNKNNNNINSGSSESFSDSSAGPAHGPSPAGRSEEAQSEEAEAESPAESPAGAETWRGSSTGRPPVGQISVNCRDFGPSGLAAHPPLGVTQGYTCRLKREQRHKSLVLLDAIPDSLLNVVHHFVRLRRPFVSARPDSRLAVVNHYKFQAWPEFRRKFERRVSAYVANWKEDRNPNSHDRTPGLGTEEIKPVNWEHSFCEVDDTRLRDYARRVFSILDDGPSTSTKMTWQA